MMREDYTLVHFGIAKTNVTYATWQSHDVSISKFAKYLRKATTSTRIYLLSKNQTATVNNKLYLLRLAQKSFCVGK